MLSERGEVIVESRGVGANTSNIRRTTEVRKKT